MASILKVDQLQKANGSQHSSISLGMQHPSLDYPGLSASNPAISAKELKDVYNFGSEGMPGNGWYWIQPAGESLIYTYCDFTTEGGGWTMIMSYIWSNRNNSFWNNNNIACRQDGFSEFITPRNWRLALKSGAQHEFLAYNSNSGVFDGHSANNFYVAQPASDAQNFLIGSGNSVSGIAGYGKCRGYTIGQAPYSTSYHAYWWYNTSYMPHVDTGHVPGAPSSEDSFGYYGTRNTSIINDQQYLVWMVR